MRALQSASYCLIVPSVEEPTVPCRVEMSVKMSSQSGKSIFGSICLAEISNNDVKPNQLSVSLDKNWRSKISSKSYSNHVWHSPGILYFYEHNKQLKKKWLNLQNQHLQKQFETYHTILKTVSKIPPKAKVLSFLSKNYSKGKMWHCCIWCLGTNYVLILMLRNSTLKAMTLPVWGCMVGNHCFPPLV